MSDDKKPEDKSQSNDNPPKKVDRLWNQVPQAHSLALVSTVALGLWVAVAAVFAAWRGFGALSSRWWLLALFVLSLAVALSRAPLTNDAGSADKNKKPSWRLWSVAFLGSVVWWAFASQHSVQRLVLLVGLSLSSFMVGCFAGFLFTSYGQEKDTIGKVRDWLLGGITGLTLAQASNIKLLLRTFALNDTNQEFALVASVAVIYCGVGFFFMFLERELILNLWLAQSRAERGRLEGIETAGHVAMRLIQALPASVLSGTHDISDAVDDDQAEEDLRKLLFSEDVKTFLEDAEEAAKTGAPVDWDVASKVANLHYYLTYFGDKKTREAEAERAAEWILRALNINPMHVDLSVKYADVLDLMGRPAEAVAILKRVERTPDAPAFVRQWLGYYLLELDGAEDEAIHYSLEYHRQYPDETDSFFNIARAYTRKYCKELVQSGSKVIPQSENRQRALEYLNKALQAQPDYRDKFREKWFSDTPEGDDWKCVVQDNDFRHLVGLPPVSQ